MPKLKIGPEVIEKDKPPYKSVLLDGKEIMKIDTQKYMGIRKDQTEELRKKLSEVLGYNVERQTMNTAMILEFIPSKNEVAKE